MSARRQNEEHRDLLYKSTLLYAMAIDNPFEYARFYLNNEIPIN